jgi:sulfide:quinone oxidoreductase
VPGVSDRPCPKNVVIAGGGFAAVEAALALRALATDEVRVTVIAPEPLLSHRPAATTEAFTTSSSSCYDLAALLEDIGAQYRRGWLEAVAPRDKRIRLGSGARMDYDALILAMGARASVSIPGALTFRDQRDLLHARRFLANLCDGVISRAVFAVPSGCSWSLPLYELALLTAAHAQECGVDVAITLVSPEAHPLEVFGSQASGLIARELVDRGVRFRGRLVPEKVHRGRGLLLKFGEAIAADSVIAVPQLHGPRIVGIPSSWWGFVPTDSLGRVEGLDDVYAAGDMTTFPIKQGGLAAQQADVIAETIAASYGADVKEPRSEHVLRARLLGGEHPLFLRAELDAFGSPTGATIQHEQPGTPPGAIKVFGRYLTPYFDARQLLSA